MTLEQKNSASPKPVVSNTAVFSVEDRVFAEQVRLLYDQGLPAMLAAPLCGLMLAAVLWPVTPHHRLIVWVCVVCVVTAMRMYQVWRYRHTPSASDVKGWARAYAAGSFVAGCYWGAAVPYLFPVDHPQYQYVLILVICLLLVSIMFSFSALKRAFFAVSLPTMLPLIATLTIWGDRSEQIIGAGLVLFSTVVILYTLRIHRILKESLALRFENIDLIEDLKATRVQTDALNESLMRSRALLESTLQASAGGLASFDPAGTLVTWNQKFIDAWGMSPEQATNMPREAFLKHMQMQLRPEAMDSLIDVLRELKEAFPPVHLVLETNDGRIVETHGEPQRVDGKVFGSVWSLHDITESRKSEERLRYMAQHDPLTGLPNRGLLYDRLKQAVLRSERSGRLSAVFYLDMDGFKKVNDECGHQAGDLLLQGIAQRIKSCLRASDTVARIGGDEFVVVLEQFDESSQVEDMAKAIVEKLGKPYTLNGQECSVTVSVGIALCPTNGNDPDDLLNYADAAMYSIKQSSGNAFSTFN